MTEPTPPPPEVLPATDEGILLPDVVFDEGAAEPLLEFMPEVRGVPEAADRRLSGVVSPIEHPSVPLVPSSVPERRSPPSIKRPLDRAHLLGERLRQVVRRCLPGMGIRNSARHPPVRHVSLISAIGGAAVGALAMWLFAVRPAQVARDGQPTVTATETALIRGATLPVPVPDASGSGAAVAGGATLQARASAPPVVLRLPSATTGIADLDRGPSPPRSMGYRGSVVFQSEPSGAQVFVNGQDVGSTPLVLGSLSVGSRAVRLEAQGYQSWSSAVQVVANRQTRVTVHLDRAR
jgi:hypothetical protein